MTDRVDEDMFEDGIPEGASLAKPDKAETSNDESALDALTNEGGV